MCSLQTSGCATPGEGDGVQHWQQHNHPPNLHIGHNSSFSLLILWQQGLCLFSIRAQQLKLTNKTLAHVRLCLLWETRHSVLCSWGEKRVRRRACSSSTRRRARSSSRWRATAWAPLTGYDPWLASRCQWMPASRLSSTCTIHIQILYRWQILTDNNRATLSKSKIM